MHGMTAPDVAARLDCMPMEPGVTLQERRKPAKSLAIHSNSVVKYRIGSKKIERKPAVARPMGQ